jgi:hypothetical protein
MPQTSSRRRLEVDWAKPAEVLAKERGTRNLEAFIGEYLLNTNGMRDFMVGGEKYDKEYAKWCGEQVGQVAARQNHTDAAVMSALMISMQTKEQVELGRDYDEARAEKLDDRLSKIEKKLAKIAPVNMAKTIENALSNCMEKMVDQLTDSVVRGLRRQLKKIERKEKFEG